MTAKTACSGLRSPTMALLTRLTHKPKAFRALISTLPPISQDNAFHRHARPAQNWLHLDSRVTSCEDTRVIVQRLGADNVMGDGVTPYFHGMLQCIRSVSVCQTERRQSRKPSSSFLAPEHSEVERWRLQPYGAHFPISRAKLHGAA